MSDEIIRIDRFRVQAWNYTPDIRPFEPPREVNGEIIGPRLGRWAFSADIDVRDQKLVDFLQVRVLDAHPVVVSLPQGVGRAFILSLKPVRLLDGTALHLECVGTGPLGRSILYFCPRCDLILHESQVKDGSHEALVRIDDETTPAGSFVRAERTVHPVVPLSETH